MRPHISIDVRDVKRSVDFYRRVFDTLPQKQTTEYAKFDLVRPPLNFSLLSAGQHISRVNHFGIEVDSPAELAWWETHLHEQGLLGSVERATDCCFAVQDKLWFTDPDGNQWEVFRVLAQGPVAGEEEERGCCLASCCA